MGSAIVIGASVAGLTAAKVLADRFEHVTVIDRDDVPDGAQPRKGVPQGHHPHVLLAAGQRALGELFPGLHDELVLAGAVPFDPGMDLLIHRYGGVWPRVSVGFQSVSFSRPLLDSALKGRVVRESNVEVRDGVAVSGLRGDATRVTGVVLDNGEALDADLVVDASGRGSRSDRWLSSLGCQTPGPVEIKIGVGYASRFLRREPGFLTHGTGILVLPTPPAKRAALLLPVEGDRWLVSMGAWHGDFPKDEKDFVKFAAELPIPTIHDALTAAQPMSDFVSYGFPSSKRRQFENLRRVPAGYVATGDALCSFNPIYGQGMTCAALEALALGRLLDKHGSASSAMAAGFYREAADIIATPWRFAVGGDFAFPETTGPKPRAIGLLNRYSRRIQLAARVDVEARKAFTSVQHLIAPPGILFRPSMVARVLRASWGQSISES